MHIRSVFMLVAVSTAAVAQANGILFETRPENVPADYLATPSGWFHPSCVIELGEEEKLDVNGNVVGRRDGLLRRSRSRCVYPRFDRYGRQVLSNHPNPPPTVNGWLVAGAAFAGAMEFISANWIVPANPNNISGQILYFFPGLEPSPTYDEILQPVLGWNTIGSGPSWTISSWNCCRNDGTAHSTLVPVGAGATLYGYVWGTNCSTDSGVCANWQVLTSIAGGAQTTFNTDAANEPLNWSLAAVYEAYNVDFCNQHSPSNSVTFSNVTVRNVGGTPVTPSWVENYYNPSPACDVGFNSPSSSTATISWCAPNATCTPDTCEQTLPDGCGGTVTCPACHHCAPGTIDCNGDGTFCVRPPAVCP